jgi:pimeloyl-ACP methyl ester carboxylesterase
MRVEVYRTRLPFTAAGLASVGQGESMACAPLCLVPGLGLAVQAWEPTLAALTTWACRCLRPGSCCCRGYGERGRGLDLSPAASAQRLHGALSERTTGAVVLVGHSASCQVVAQVAAQWPEAVRALVLIGPTTDPRAGGWPRLLGRWLRTACGNPGGSCRCFCASTPAPGPWTMLRAMDAARRDPDRRVPRGGDMPDPYRPGGTRPHRAAELGGRLARCAEAPGRETGGHPAPSSASAPVPT